MILKRHWWIKIFRLVHVHRHNVTINNLTSTVYMHMYYTGIGSDTWPQVMFLSYLHMPLGHV